MVTGFFHYSLDIAQCVKSAKAILLIHHEEFVNAHVVAKELVSCGNGVGTYFLFPNRIYFIAGKHAICNFMVLVSLLDHSSRE